VCARAVVANDVGAMASCDCVCHRRAILNANCDVAEPNAIANECVDGDLCCVSANEYACGPDRANGFSCATFSISNVNETVSCACYFDFDYDFCLCGFSCCYCFPFKIKSKHLLSTSFNEIRKREKLTLIWSTWTLLSHPCPQLLRHFCLSHFPLCSRVPCARRLRLSPLLSRSLLNLSFHHPHCPFSISK